MTMEQGLARLKEIAQKMQEDRGKGLAPSPPIPTVREFMSWFGYARRGLCLLKEYVKNWKPMVFILSLTFNRPMWTVRLPS